MRRPLPVVSVALLKYTVFDFILRGEHLYSCHDEGLWRMRKPSDDDLLEPFFTREELLEQRCDLLESELAELGDELQASREKISTLVLMWSGVTSELRAAEAEISKMKLQPLA